MGRLFCTRMSVTQRKIAVDAMGSDLGPSEVVAGVRLALANFNTLEGILLVGDADTLGPMLKENGLMHDSRIEVLHASEVIGMDEKPIQSLKNKKDSSLVRTVESLKSGRSAAGVSCGNTGSLMACATLKLRPLPGVGKPALATVWPTANQRFILLDGGANPQCKPENLVHNAVLGSLYAEDAIGIKNPRVGLLSIGTEEGKGNDLVNSAHDLLRRLNGIINYQGLVEGFDLFSGAVDVVVTDGFTGNVVLKTSEGLWKMLRGLMREEFTRTLPRKAGAALLKGAMRDIKARVDPDLFGGAPLLGLRGNMLKAHGSSSREAISHAIRIAGLTVEKNLTGNAQLLIAQANEQIKVSPQADSLA